ncbi:MAG: chloride channel protein [Dehalococcoidia bacterium]|jgi:CIC family chloride channel protein
METKYKFVKSIINGSSKLAGKYFWRTFYLIKSRFLRFIAYIDFGYLRKWLTLGILIGIVAGVGSIVFYQMIAWASAFFLGYMAGYVAPVPGGEGVTAFLPPARLWAIPLVTTLGGLISGLIVFKFAPEAEGHGTDTAIKAFHHGQGRIRGRVPFIKIVASAVTIGSGGSAGREGPVALVGAGFGSILANLFNLNSNDRRIALTVGIGSGIGSIFKAPLGGALLSAEILYRRDFEAEALLPSFIASITGYAIFASWRGWAPIFTIQPDMSFVQPLQLIGYALLGLVCGLAGMMYGRIFYGVRDFFNAIKVPNYFKPAIGGLIVGIIGMFLPQVLGMGYGWLQFGINGNYAVLPVYIMVGVLFGKIIATSLSVGSGGSGGVFAPGLVIGGMVGGVLWYLLQGFPLIIPPKADAFVIVGMMALFGGIAKAPLAIMIMVSEMTNSYVLLAPCMVAVVIAYFMTGSSYIYENQVVNRAASPAHKSEHAVPLLKTLQIKDALGLNPSFASPDATLEEVSRLMKSQRMDAVPILSNGEVMGIIANLDIASVAKKERTIRHVSEVMSRNLIIGYGYETLDVALERMTRNNISHLIIVNEEHPLKLEGILCIDDIIKAYRTHTQNLWPEEMA